MPTVVDGHTIAQGIYKKLVKQVPVLKEKNIVPKLGVILVGAHKPSQTYVKRKGEAAKKIGVGFKLRKLSSKISTLALIQEIKKMQQPSVGLTGLIVQLPLPKHINTGKVLEAISPQLDVDCLTQTNLGKLVTGSYWIEPPTPGAILQILKYHKVLLKGKKIAIIGAGALVGKPLSNMLMHEEATISILNQYTPDLSEYTKNADIVITGVGKHNLLTGDMIKEGAIVIDAGVSFVGKKMYGDIDLKSVRSKAAIVTPTPGGVGPLTVAKLIENTVKCAQKKLKK
ncbi:MAG: bifunctional 5,10-methylenetetrahydrofolate dehydrogenase/5,10-methenyltetrahydrofolate cyclohydrolase [bacterium]|nr:bifunctional 5,10-methylenetetrahydrofolate dehydrogenase/5,10-methenyltetrahydrofolate cyclohydrolase [bacterium]